MKHVLKIEISFLFVCLLALTSQAQTWQWATKAGGLENDYANSMALDNPGNNYVTGTFYDSISFGAVTLINTGTWSVYIAEYDAGGNIVWAKIAASDSLISASGISVDNAGNISITGQYFATATFGTGLTASLTSSGDYDVFVAKYTGAGDLIWAKSLGGAGIDYAGGICTDRDDNVLVTGDFHSTPYPYSGSKIFVAKFDSSGNNAWLHTEINNGTSHFGNGITTDSSGNSYITGEFFYTLTFDSTQIIDAGNVECNGYIAKFDAAGNMLWGQKLGAPSGYCGSRAIAIDAAGNAYITGYYHGTISFGDLSITGTSGLGYDVFISKCDANGNYVWVNASTGAGSVRSICLDHSGNAYISGTFQETITFGTNTFTSLGSDDIFIAKAGAAGNFVWATACGGAQDDHVTAIKATAAQLLLAGYFTGTIHFGSSLSLIANSSSKSDIYVAQLSAPVGIEEEENYLSSTTCFPNPAENEIQFTHLAGNETYLLYDALGKIMLRGSLDGANKISVATLGSGIYFIRLISYNDPEKIKSIAFVKG